MEDLWTLVRLLRRDRVIRMKLLRSAFGVFGLALGVSCSGDETPIVAAPPENPSDLALSPDIVELVPAATTTMLNTSTMQQLAEASTVDGSLRFSGAPAQLAKVDTGSVLVGGPVPAAPSGLLRVVTGKRMVGASLVLETLPAAMQLAYEKANVSITRRIEDVGKSPRNAMGKGGTFAPLGGPRIVPQFSKKVEFFEGIDLGFVPYDGDNNLSTKNNQMVVNGKVGAGLTFKFTLTFDWGALKTLIPDAIKCVPNPFCSVASLLPELKAGLEADASAEANFGIEGAASLPFDTGQKPLGDGFTLAQIVVPPGLVFDVLLDYTGQIDGEASSLVKFGAKAKLGIRASMTASTKNPPSFDPPKPYREFAVQDVQAALTGRARLRVGPRLSVLLYGTFGPTLGAQFSTTIEADASRTPCYKVLAGIDASVGVRFRIPWEKIGLAKLAKLLGIGFDYSKEYPFNLVSETVTSGACIPPPLEHVPPGDGPSSASLNSPTFAPWSNAYDVSNQEFATGFQPSSVPGEVWTDLTKSIDGNDVLVSSESPYTVKIDPLGRLVWSKMLIAQFASPGGDLVRHYIPPGAAVSSVDTKLWIFGAPRGRLEPSRPPVAVQLDQSGQVLQSFQFSTSATGKGGLSGLRAALQMPNTDMVILTDARNDDETTDVVVLRIKADGEVIWAKTIDAQGSELATTLLPFDDGGIMVAAYDWNPKQNNSFLVKLDANGNKVWAKQLKTCTGLAQTTAGRKTGNDEALLVGRYGYAPAAPYLASISSAGALVQYRALASASNVRDYDLTGIAALATTGFLAAGTHDRGTDLQDRNSATFRGLSLSGLDSLGAVQWTRRFSLPSLGGLVNLEATHTNLRLTADGGAVLIGDMVISDPALGNSMGLWVSKVPAKNGELTLKSGVENAAVMTQAAGCAISIVEAPLVTVVDRMVTRESLSVTAEAAVVSVVSMK
jgi:hypothetical protein